MKKLVFASVMALASISLVSAPTLRAQDSRSPSRIRQSSTPIKWPSTQTDPKAKAAALESFSDRLIRRAWSRRRFSIR